MAIACHLTTHGAHFPGLPTNAAQSHTPPRADPTLGLQHQTPHVSAPPPAKLGRADSVVSAATLPLSNVNTQQDSVFFRLPAELRNVIYTALLCDNAPMKLTDLCLAPRIPAPAHTHPAILSTCRRIHAEAVNMLYATHVFHAHPSLLTALPHLASSARPVLYPTVLRRIVRWQLAVRLDTDPRFTAAQATAAFSGAEFLEVRASQSMFDGCSAGVLKLFMDVRGVKMCRVTGSVEEGLARWLEAKMMGPVEEKADGEGRCECEVVRYARCEDCDGRVRLDGNGAGLWMEEGDAWRFGNS